MGKNVAIIILGGLLVLAVGLLVGSNPRLFGEWPARDFLAREARLAPVHEQRSDADEPSRLQRPGRR